MNDNRNHKILIVLALISVYLVWGSTYYAIRVALDSYPPFILAGMRFLAAGVLLFGWLLLRGAKIPSPRQWLNGGIVGTLLLVGGNGGVTVAEQWIATGLAAVIVAGVPLWTALFSGLFGQWPRRIEWIGLFVGLVGVALLMLEGDLQASPFGAALLVAATMSWGFGSILSRRVDMPSGLMSSAVQMLVGSAVFLILSFVSGEQFPVAPSATATWGIVYLVFFGSLVGYTAYTFLLQNVKPTLATSYAYVNPVVAVLLGTLLLGESITLVGIGAMVVILTGVALLAIGRERTRPPVVPAPPAQLVKAESPQQ